MNHPERSPGHATPRGRLRLFEAPLPLNPSPPVARWLINGFPATVIIWTKEQWADLDERPDDAQCLTDGIWCALRMD